MPNPLAAARQDMQQEAAEKFHGVEGQSAQPVAMLVILGAKGHLAVVEGEQPLGGERHARRRAGQILQDMLRGAEGLLRVDHPLGCMEASQEAVPCRQRRQRAAAPRKGEGALGVCVAQRVKEQVAEAPTEDLHRQEEVWATREPPRPIGCQPPSRQDTMEMRMMVELLAPGMEPGEAADVRPKMLRVSGDVLERLCHGPKEHAVEDAGILEAQGTEGVWQREHHMDIGDIEHFAFPRGEPGHLSGSVTRGAVAVATGIITDLLVATVVTRGFVAPQGGGTADGDGAQGPTLICREGSARACQEEVAILLDHIRHFEAWAGHTSVSSGNASSGLGVACRACGVTWR